MRKPLLHITHYRTKAVSLRNLQPIFDC